MEVVKQFNAELSSLYETKPPISKAKMTQITRSAMKAIKFYKHVVQSVEKFIQKCKAEYKVPGLYVIDSIVRQSRHQYTPEKDVFAPRFARNIQNTFLHLFNCTPEDKSKIVRVLNLWQKNNVFSAEVIQPLLDLASAVAAREPPNGVPAKTTPISQQPAAARTPSPPRSPATIAWLAGARNPDFTKSLDKNSPAKDAWLTGGRIAEHNLEPKIAPVSAPKVKMDKKLFEYDYGEDEDGDAGDGISPRGGSTAPATPASQQNVSIESLSSILSNPEVLRQLHTLQQQMAARKQQEMEEKMRRLQEMKHQEEEFDRHLAQTVPNLPFAAECDLKPSSSGTGLELPLMVPPPSQPPQPLFPQPLFSIADHSSDFDERSRQLEEANRGHESESAATEDDSRSVEVIDLVRSPVRESDRRRRRSRSRGRRSRSRSRSRRRRSRSNDKDDRKWDSRQREIEREKDRERRKKSLPPIKKNHLTVCSTTLWVGHLSKLIQEDQLSNIFGEYGEIVSINLIPPRGCAFICMNRRQDAQKALHGLKYVKIQGKSITMAWAPGKGMKEKAWKDYWDVELGASFIPWNKLSPKTDFTLLEDGGTLDPDTFPEWLKEKYQSEGRSTNENIGGSESIGKLDGELPPLPVGPQPPTSHLAVQPIHPAQPPSGLDPTPAPLPPPSLPPSAPAGPPLSLLPPPPPFPLQPRLLGPMGAMPMGPGLVGNMPLGVPPPMMMAPQVVTRLPGPPHFNPPGMGFMGSLDKRDGMLGVPPPLPSMPAMTTPFGIPEHAFQGNHSDKANHDPMEMDVVNDMDEDSTDKDNMLSFHGSRGGGYDERDTDMRKDELSNRDPNLPPEPFSLKWIPVDKDRKSSSGDKEAGMRPPLIGPPPPMPHFDQFSSHPGRRDEDGTYPPSMREFSRNQFFGGQRGRSRPLLRPNGPMFNQQRGPPPSNDLPPRPHLQDWGMGGGRGVPPPGGDRGGRGGNQRGGRFSNFGGPHPHLTGPPPNMLGAPPPTTAAPPPPGAAPPPFMSALLPTPPDPPTPVHRRRQDGERRSRWSAPAEPPPFPPPEAATSLVSTVNSSSPAPFAPAINPPVAFNTPPPCVPGSTDLPLGSNSASPESALNPTVTSTDSPSVSIPTSTETQVPSSPTPAASESITKDSTEPSESISVVDPPPTLYSPSGEDSAPAITSTHEDSGPPAPVTLSVPIEVAVTQENSVSECLFQPELSPFPISTSNKEPSSTSLTPLTLAQEEFPATVIETQKEISDTMVSNSEEPSAVSLPEEAVPFVSEDLLREPTPHLDGEKAECPEPEPMEVVSEQPQDHASSGSQETQGQADVQQNGAADEINS